MSDNLSLLHEIYQSAEQELKSRSRRNPPVIVGRTLIDYLITEYEKETGIKAEPNDKGIYKMYDFDVIVFGGLDETIDE